MRSLRKQTEGRLTHWYCGNILSGGRIRSGRIYVPVDAMSKILVKIWLNHPGIFKLACWVKGHKWYQVDNDGAFVNDFICLRCAKGKVKHG